MLGSAPLSSSPLSSTTAGLSLTHARVLQQAIEVLRTGTAVKARASQMALEVLRTNTAVKIRASQFALEVLRQNNAETPLGGNTGAFFPFFE